MTRQAVLKGLSSFLKKASGEEAWGRALGDEKYLRARGFDAESGRRHVKDLLRRNRSALASTYELTRHFLDEYRDICTAYKHGRAVFNLSHSVTMDASAAIDSLSVQRRDDSLLAVRLREHEVGELVSLVEFVLDEGAIQSVYQSSEAVCSLVLRISDQMLAIVGSLESHLHFLEGRAEPGDHSIPFLLLVDAPTAEDLRLLGGTVGGPIAGDMTPKGPP